MINIILVLVFLFAFTLPVYSSLSWTASQSSSDSFRAPAWAVQITEDSSTVDPYSHKIELKVTLPTYPSDVPVTPISDIKLSCTTIVNTVESVAVTTTQTGSTFSAEYIKTTKKLTGFKCMYESVRPVYIQVTYSTQLTQGAGYLVGSEYYHAGFSLYSLRTTPPISFEFDPNNSLGLIATMYQIQDGLFDLSRVSLIFQTSFTSVQLSQEVLDLYPAATVQLSSITTPRLSVLQFNNIPRDAKQVKFQFATGNPTATLTYLSMYACLREQNAIYYSNLSRLATSSYISTTPALNQNGLISIQPSTKFIPQNGFKLNFQYTVKRGDYVDILWMLSPLTSLIRIFQCGNTEGSAFTTPALQSVIASHRSSWVFSSSVNTVEYETTPALITCEVMVSSLLSTYNVEELVNYYLFENLPYNIYNVFQPPQPVAVRRNLLNSLVNNLTPFTTKINTGYFTSIYSLTTPSATVTGLRHNVEIFFPGLFHYNELQITLPSSYSFRSALFLIQSNQFDARTFSTTYNSQNDVSTAPSIQAAPLIPAITTANGNTNIWKLQTGDLVNTGISGYKGIDLIDFRLVFDIYVPMNAVTNSNYQINEALQYSDNSNRNYHLSVQLQQYSTIGLPSRPQPLLTKQFDLDIGTLGMKTPPNMVTKNTAIPSGSDGVVQVPLILRQTTPSTNPSSAYYQVKSTLSKGDVIKLVIGSKWTTKFKFGTQSITNTPFSLLSSTDSTFELLIQNDIEIIDDIIWNFSLNWLVPAAVITSLDINITLISGSALPTDRAVTYKISPKVIQFSDHSLHLVESTGRSTMYAGQPDAQNSSPIFGLTVNDSIQFDIAFFDEIISTNNIPEEFQITLSYLNLSPSGSIILVPIQLGQKTFTSDEYTVVGSKLSLQFSIPDLLTYPFISEHLFINIRYLFPNPTGFIPAVPQIVSSDFFTLFPICFQPTKETSGFFTSLPSDWKSICGENGACSSNGTCRCAEFYSGELCESEPDPCLTSTCIMDNTDTCTESGSKCICSDGWSGVQCQIPDECLDQSAKQCRNGFLTQDAANTTSLTCSQTCQCKTNWIGTSCSTCSLQCQNGGMAFKQCDKCGCDTGFTGSNCQCRGVTGSIVINGYSLYYLDYASLLTTSNGKAIIPESTLTSLLALQSYNSLYNAITTHVINEMDLDHQLSVTFKLGEIGLPSFDKSASLGIQSMTTSPIDTITKQYPTKLTVTILFGCNEFNPSYTNDQIRTKWNDMVENLATSVMVRDNFVLFNDNIQNNLNDIDNTLPGPDDRLQNEEESGGDNGGEDGGENNGEEKSNSYYIGLSLFNLTILLLVVLF